jgi:hypothetical protein
VPALVRSLLVATTGVVGQRWRAGVTDHGVVEPHDGTASLGWYVAADDRWHDPLTDTGVRHERVAGTAVFETRMRIPGGDAVQRVWSVADSGGFTIVSVHNDSPAPIAVAFTRGDLATTRPAADIAIVGIALPAGAVAFPVGHRATITVGLAHSRRGPSSLPSGLPTADAVVRGWVTRTDVASRLDLPDQEWVDAVRAARCELLLGDVADVAAEPERHLLGVAELVRLGDLDVRGAIEAAPRIASAVAAVVRRGGSLGAAALDAATVVLAAAGERQALADLARLRESVNDGDITGATASFVRSDDVAVIPAVERCLAAGPVLFPGGIPDRWRGHDVEAHGLVAGPASRLSLALRWHGANVAVLWEVDGEPVTLRSTVGLSPWTSAEPRGDVLWRFAQRGER